jgi:murein DD-endopeptidase MepM/ murein hydrolase activator NlpD
MRLRITAAFVLGFALGVLCLATVLWRYAGLNIAIVRRQPAPVPFDLNGMMQQARDLPPQPPAVPPPVSDFEQPAPGPAPHGEADRMDLGGAPRLAMPIAGVDSRNLTDNFSETRDGHRHGALDIMAPRGAPVLAAAEGNVAKLFNSKQGGLCVYQFTDKSDWCLYYAHLDHYAPGLHDGTLLRKGDVLGYVGTTGDAPANAPHLHFAVFKLGPDKKWWQGTPVDPLPLLQ